MPDRYSRSSVDGFLVHPRSRTRSISEVAAELGMVVEEAGSGFCGAVVACEADAVHLEDRHRRVRVFPLSMVFSVEGQSVRLVRPRPTPPAQDRLRSASGSTLLVDHQARVAVGSRIYVEGIHDAELVEKVWGHDLRVEGVVVEPLHGIDDLPSIVASFAPTSDRRLGVLVDHLVPGSKESRIAARVRGADVLVVGHPFVDIWQAIRPSVVGIQGWPEIPHGQPWKEGICVALGWKPDTGVAWRQLLARVRNYSDLEPALLGRVEELIDFVTSTR